MDNSPVSTISEYADYDLKMKTLNKYMRMLMTMSPDEQDQLLLNNKIPQNLSEALDLFVREAMLYQQIYAEQIKVLEDMEANPEKHTLLASYFERLDVTMLEMYEEAQRTLHWCNLLIRYAGWIARNQEHARPNVDLLYKMIFEMSQMYQAESIRGQEREFKGLQRMNCFNSSGLDWMLCKLREVIIPRPSRLRQTAWFHDCFTPGLRFYNRSREILRRFANEPAQIGIVDFTANYLLIQNMYERMYNLMIFVGTHSPNGLSCKDVCAIWADIYIGPYGLKILKHWADESVTDRDFEASVIKPLERGALPTQQPATKKSGTQKNKYNEKEQKQKQKPLETAVLPNQQPTVNKNDEAQRNQHKKKGQKRKQKKMQMPKRVEDAPSVATSSGSNAVLEIDEHAACPLEKMPTVVSGSAPLGGPSNWQIEDESQLPAVSVPIKNGQAEEEAPFESCASKDDDDDVVWEKAEDKGAQEVGPLEKAEGKEAQEFEASGKAEDKEGRDVESWEEEIVRERDRFALENKKRAQARKVYRQERAAQERSARQARLRQNMQTGPARSTFRIGIDSTELCLAYPDAFSLFRSNENICMSKGKSYRWVFDPNVVIRQEHMDFLCSLFGLEGGGGSQAHLTFQEMVKTYWAIEQCLHSTRPGDDSRRTVFKWSHSFEINNDLVAPLMKGVHPEHGSQRFDRGRALALFEGGGFDPRFFEPNH